MARKRKIKSELKGKARLRSEIMEAMHGLHKTGVVSDAGLEKTTLRMLGRDALPKVDPFSPMEIAKLRARRRQPRRIGGLSQRGREYGQSVGARRVQADRSGVETAACGQT